MKRSVVPVLLAVWLGAPAWALAQAGYTSANFLKLGMGARAVGMADSFTALADDATAVYWNPAGLAQTPGTDISLTHTEYLQGTKIDFVALSQSLGDDGAVGAAFSGLGVSPFASTQENSSGGYSGTGPLVNVSDWSLSLAYANRLGRWLGGDLFKDTLVGLAANLTGQNEVGPNGTAVAFDAGVIQLFPDDHLALALDVQNVGTEIQNRFEPVLFKVGAAWYRLNNFDPSDRLTLTADADVHTDTGFQPSLGGEYGIGLDRQDRGFLRAGLRTTDDQFGFSFLTLGAGLERDFSGFTAGLDYALVPYGTLGTTHWFTLNVKLGREGIHARLSAPDLFHLDEPIVPLAPGGGSDAPLYDWMVSLTDEQGAAVQSFGGQGAPPKVLNWDGKNQGGTLVAPGTYVARLRVRDTAGMTADAGPVSFRAVAPLTMADFKWSLRSDAIFATAQADLLPEGKSRLETVEKGLEKYFIESKVQIQGYTDSQPCRLGPHCRFKNNEELSQARAKTVQDLFLSMGLKPENVDIVWFADRLPVAPNDSPEGRAQNRRIEVVVQSARGGETPDTMMNAGIFLMNNGLNDQALQLFQKVADYEPANPQPWRLLGTCLFNLGRLDEAAQAGQKADALENSKP
jgi:outer membrane protein OmpA-like peptidoglycan-associated protein